MELPFAESWKIKMVEPIRRSTREEREQWIKEAHYNVFQLKAEQVYIDLLTDSGTGSMSDRQWAGIMLGDESYAGGQPVSMQNLKEVRAIADKYGKPVVFDSARFAENAYFIKTREEGYKDKTIKEITKEMFALADGMTMSAKKDGIVNMGGFIATKRQDWYEGAKGYCVQFEGYLTYGGMNGRDMNALAIGLDENTEFDNLQTRIHQVEYLASLLDEYGIPYQRPAGGHAIFVDAPKVLTHVPKEEFPAQTLTIELYLEAGIRGCEIGYLLADRDPITRENRFNGLDLLRLAIPRRVYTDNHMAVIAAALKNVFDRRMQITHGVRIAWEAPLMRHFTVQLERITD
jgi:tryptophanase